MQWFSFLIIRKHKKYNLYLIHTKIKTDFNHTDVKYVLIKLVYFKLVLIKLPHEVFLTEFYLYLFLYIFSQCTKMLPCPFLSLTANSHIDWSNTLIYSRACKLVGKNVQLNFGENINSGVLQKLYLIYIFWNLNPISYTLK